MSLATMSLDHCPVCGPKTLHEYGKCTHCHPRELPSYPDTTKANALSSRRSERTSYVFNNRQRGTGGV